MHCQKASEHMSLRLDGRLTAAERAELDDHISECAACAKEWQSLMVVTSLFADAEVAEPSPRLEKKVMRRVRQHEWRVRMTRGLGLGIVSFLVLLGISAVALAGVWSVALGRSSVGHGIVLVSTQAASTLRNIVRALSLMGQAALGGPIGLAVLAALVITGILTVQWLRVLVRPATVRA